MYCFCLLSSNRWLYAWFFLKRGESGRGFFSSIG